MDQSLAITFANIVADADRASLLIEQDEWHINTGFVTKANFYRYLFNLITGASNDIGMDCGVSIDNTVASTIRTYPSTPSLNYTLLTSYGSLAGPSVNEYNQKESIHFSLDNEASLKYPLNGSLISQQWVGDIYDFYGNICPTPNVSISGDQLILDRKVYGTLLIEYPVVRHNYILEAKARDIEGETEDLFGAVVYGLYANGISWLDITNPPYVDEISNGASCGGVTVGSDPGGGIDEPKPPTTCPQITVVNTYDYCSLDLINHTETRG